MTLSNVRLRLHGAIYRPDSFVMMLRYRTNLKKIRHESTTFNSIEADKSHRVIGAFYLNSLIHTLSVSNSHDNVASIQKNRGDKSNRVIVALHDATSLARSLSRNGVARHNRELKQTGAAAANLKISIQKDSRPSESSRPLTSITLNLNGDLHVDRRRVSLLKLPIAGRLQRVTCPLCNFCNLATFLGLQRLKRYPLQVAQDMLHIAISSCNLQ